ncbi:phage tail assembly protein [Lonsdalea quercina]|uniref:phage tail assembly protein n=1 Tax=Lonsdalea quercina TaxID=71657 RepID=UPI003975AC95
MKRRPFITNIGHPPLRLAPNHTLEHTMSDSEKYLLQFPYSTPAGERLTELTLRRLKAKDLKAVMKLTDNASDWDSLLLARASDMVPEDLDEMDLADFMELSKRFQKLSGVVKSEGTDGSTGAAGEVVSVSAE